MQANMYICIISLFMKFIIILIFHSPVNLSSISIAFSSWKVSTHFKFSVWNCWSTCSVDLGNSSTNTLSLCLNGNASFAIPGGLNSWRGKPYSNFCRSLVIPSFVTTASWRSSNVGAELKVVVAFLPWELDSWISKPCELPKPLFPASRGSLRPVSCSLSLLISDMSICSGFFFVKT